MVTTVISRPSHRPNKHLGGVMVGSSQYQCITDRFNNKRAELNLYQEVKWEKVSEPYLEKYTELVRAFFEEIALGNL